MNIKRKVRDIIRQETRKAIRESGVSAGLKKLNAKSTPDVFRQIVREELKTALYGLQANVKQAENIAGGGITPYLNN